MSESAETNLAVERPPIPDVELPGTTVEELAEARRYSMVFTWSPEDAVWIVSFPEFPGALTHGETLDEATAMAEDALALMISVNRHAGRGVPAPPRTARRFVAAVPPELAAADIRSLRETLNVSQQLLAAALNVSDSAVQSWEQGRKQPEGAALRLLDLFRRHPELLEELIEQKAPAGSAS
jgi:putative transcriptional regulator